MDCDSVKDLFSEYIEHQLDSEKSMLFEMHMEECDECRKDFYKFEKMLIRLKAIKDVEPPKELKNKIMNKVISEENKKLNAKIINFRRCFIVLMVVIIFIGIINYYIKKIKINNLPDKILSELDNFTGNGDFIEEIQENEFQDEIEDGINRSINLYEKGIEFNIITSDIENFKSFLYLCTENIKFYEENPNYVEFVADQNEFCDLEEKINEINEYYILIENLDDVKESIKKVIEENDITEFGLIKFKINIIEKEENT